MVDTKQLNQQVDYLVDLLKNIVKIEDNLEYLQEIKDTADMTTTRQNLELAKDKADLVISAIEKRKDLLDADHAKIFKAITD